jgi:acetyl esterase/lipase
MKSILLTILLFSLMFPSLFAQHEVIKLWPEGIPGSILNHTYSEYTEKGSDGISRVHKVTDPELIVYPAPDDLATGTAVIICPGGGYHILAIEHEGYYIAEWLNSKGITAFILKYRLPADEIMQDKCTGPLQDAQKAIRIVRSNAQKYNIDPEKIGIMGFSAGGHLASTLSTHYNENIYACKKPVNARPDFSILIYPVISMDESITHMGSRTKLLGKHPTEDKVEHFSNEKMVDKNTPITFLVHAADDPAVPVENSINYFIALKNHNIPAEMHIYEKGGHGFGIRNLKGTVADWTYDLEQWLRMHELIK